MIEVFFAFLDLLESEARVVVRGAVRYGWVVSLIGVVCILLTIGMGLWVWAVYQYLSPLISSAGGAFFAGLTAMFQAGIIAWLIWTQSR